MAVATQWNTAKPAMGNQVSADVPDIEENFEEIERILEAITNGTLGTTDSDLYKVDSIADATVTAAMLAAGAVVTKGLVFRAKFIYYDADELYISAGMYHHHGTVEQNVYWDSKLTFKVGSAGSNAHSSDLTNAWHYLYLDDSAIVTLGTNLLDNTCFLNHTTAPTWSEAKHGWYGTAVGNLQAVDRCIFAIYGDATPNITEFIHAGNTVMWADGVETQAAVDIDDTFTDIAALRIPGFATLGLVFFERDNTSGNHWWWRTNGQTGTVGHRILRGLAANVIDVGTPMKVITDSSQIIEVKKDVAGTQKISCWTEGWIFPIGM